MSFWYPRNAQGVRPVASQYLEYNFSTADVPEGDFASGALPTYYVDEWCGVGEFPGKSYP